MLKCQPKDIYVNKTIRRKYKKSDVSDAMFMPSYYRVEY